MYVESTCDYTENSLNKCLALTLFSATTLLLLINRKAKRQSGRSLLYAHKMKKKMASAACD